MNNKFFNGVIIFITLSAANLMNGQEIDFNKQTISEVKEYEKNLNSVMKDSLIEFGILKNPQYDLETLLTTKTLIFKRSEDNFDPKLHTWYHYNDDLTKLKGKRYHWGLYNPSFNPRGNEKWLKKLSKNEKKFRKKYQSLEKSLKSELGKPIKKKTIADNNYKFVENIFWEDDEKIVGLSMSFDRKIKEIPGIGIFANFKIEVMITYK